MQPKKTTFQATPLLKGLQQLSERSSRYFVEAMQANTRAMQDLVEGYQQSFDTEGKQHKVACCPPQEKCPPHCLAILERRAHPGEVIVVPFVVRNVCGGIRKYHIGVRPLHDPEGQPTPKQPVVDKNEVTLQPDQAVIVRLKLDLSEGFQPGACYQTEIVLREKEVNQNICFRLCVEGYGELPEIHPRDEHEYFHHFVGWDKHFYCETGRNTTGLKIKPEVDALKSKTVK